MATANMTRKASNGAVLMADTRRPAKLVNSDEMAERLCVSARTVQRMARDGEIPCVRVGRCVRFDADDVMDAVTGRRRYRDAKTPADRLSSMTR